MLGIFFDVTTWVFRVAATAALPVGIPVMITGIYAEFFTD